MDNKSGRDSSVPRGTFSTMPPKPAEAAVEVKADESKYPRTLVGVPSLPPQVLESAKGPFPAPPKWRGAAAYEGEASPQASEGVPLAKVALRPRGIVEQLPAIAVLGSTPPEPTAVAAETSDSGLPEPEPIEASAEPDAPAKLSGNISEAIQDMLAAQASVPMEVESEQLSDADLVEEPEAQSAPRSSKPGPFAAPLPPIQSAPSLGRISIAPLQETFQPVSAAMFASSLAPVDRPPPASEQTVEPPKGFWLIAAMVAIGVGGWWFTQGGYRPHAQPAAAAAVPEVMRSAENAAPSVEPVASAAPVLVAAPTPTPTPVVAAPTSAIAPSLATERKPRVETRARALAQSHAGAVAGRVEPTAEHEAAPVVSIRAVNENGEMAAPASAPVAVSGDLPDVPSREDVLAAMGRVESAIRACAPGLGGIAEINLVVSSNGRVTHAVVAGDYAGRPEGSCIVKAVRNAQFSPFARPRFSVMYPFPL